MAFCWGVYLGRRKINKQPLHYSRPAFPCLIESNLSYLWNEKPHKDDNTLCTKSIWVKAQQNSPCAHLSPEYNTWDWNSEHIIHAAIYSQRHSSGHIFYIFLSNMSLRIQTHIPMRIGLHQCCKMLTNFLSDELNQRSLILNMHQPTAFDS